MLSTILLVLIAAMGFGLLVLIHELGHFGVAKALKIEVEAFSFGFGPHIGKRWGGTEYRLSLIPWGGYVKFSGGEQREAGREPLPHELAGRPAWQRGAVFAAGSVMNGVLGVAAFIVAFAVGVPSVPPVIGEVIVGGPAWRAGLREDDRVVAIDGLRTSLDFTDLQSASMLGDAGRPIDLTVEREGQRLYFRVAPEYDERHGMLTIGVGAKQTLKVAAFAVYEDGDKIRFVERAEELRSQGESASPAVAAGLEVGDELFELNGQALRGPQQFIDLVADSQGQPVLIKYRRGQETQSVQVQPVAQGEAYIGVVYGSTTVQAVRKGSWAELVGLRPGDTIVKVNGREVSAASQIEASLAEAKETVTFELAGKPKRSVAVPKSAALAPQDAVVFEPQNIVSRLMPGFPAALAGIVPGDRIRDIGGHVVGSKEAAERTAWEPGKPLLVRWEHEGERRSARIAPQRMWVMGAAFGQLEEHMKLGLWQSCVVGSRKAFRWIPRIYLSFKGLITGTVPRRQMGGPISIAVYTYESAKRGPGTLAYFLAFMSMNLALLNLLPIPVLDGGHLLFTVIERVKGSPVSERVQVVASYVGLVFLVALMLYATFNDARGLLGVKF